jgi:hypothetical protein
VSVDHPIGKLLKVGKPLIGSEMPAIIPQELFDRPPECLLVHETDMPTLLRNVRS